MNKTEKSKKLTRKGTLKKLKKNVKGITLIALVVTIIVLLILAGVAINLSVGENGIFKRAQLAQNEAIKASKNESKTLVALEAGMNLENREYVDSEGLKAMIPAGFAVSQEDGENLIEKGLVIIGKDGNEFVWIPVTKDENGNPTKPYEDTNGKLKQGSDIEIKLGRYIFDSVTGSPSESVTGYTEDTVQNHNSYYKNEIASNITEFKESVKQNGGYYIGRFEAGVEGFDPSKTITSNTNSEVNWTGYNPKEGENLRLVFKAGAQVWNYITQSKASYLCKNLYSEVNSDLINSYAWDTAILFIQNCGTEINSSKYSIQIGQSTTNAISKSGETILLLGDGAGKNDKQCNIYDMAGNAWEWSTETNGIIDYPCIYRGGGYNYNANSTSHRYHANTIAAYSSYTFRAILYL